MTVDYCVEVICNKGCQSVRADIRSLERHEVIPEVQQMSTEERGLVLAELKKIMAVYGDSCRITGGPER